MSPSEHTDLAARYFVDDLPGALQVGARLHSILTKIGAGDTASQAAKDYLLASGLHSLFALAEGRLGSSDFERDAEAEQTRRVSLARELAAEALKAEARQAAERAAASAAIFDDPDFRRRQDARQLRRKFDIGYVEPHLYPRLMRLLRDLAEGRRIRAEDAAWLQTEGEDYWNGAVARAWHSIEAEALTAEWRRSGNPWAAINASGHWRKADKAANSLLLTEQALPQARSPKVRSALLTTRGGALRDENMLEDAKAAGERAHQLLPKDYRPCTLLGAVSFEMNDFAAGHEWFIKAEELGATRKSIDQDIRALLAKVGRPHRDRIVAFLLEQDPERFHRLRR